MVVSIVAYLLEVVVFAGYAQAFLRIGHTLVADPASCRGKDP